MLYLPKLKFSLKYKFIALFMAITLLIVCSISLFSYLEASRTIRYQTNSLGEQILVQINTNLDQYYTEYMQLLLMLGNSPEFNRWKNVPPGDTYEKVQVYNRVVANYLGVFSFRFPEIMSFTFYNDLGNEIHFNNSKSLKESHTLRDTPWLDLSEHDKMSIEIAYSHSYVEPNLQVMTMVKRLGSGLVKMDVSLEPTLNILSKVDDGLKGGQAFLINQEGTILVHPSKDMVFHSLEPEIAAKVIEDDRSGFFVREKTGETVVYSTIPFTEWISVVIVPYENVQESFSKTRDFIVGITLIGLAVSYILVVLATNSLTKRLYKLQKVIRQTQVGHIQYRVRWDGDDEIAELGKAYNQMLDHLMSTIDKLAETRSLEQQAVLRSLQAQINSHFLYNALESINSMAYLDGHKPIEQTTLALSEMLRYTSEYTQTEVVLDQEIRHVINYVHIMQFRYPSEIDFSYEIGDHAAKAICLKATIQPLVENSIKHGLERTGLPLSIRLNVSRVEDAVIITVKDNGPGFQEGTLQRLEEETRQITRELKQNYQGTSGLLNVHFRLTTLFPGGDSGVRFSNAPDGGAIVELRFPYRL
jgi:two-component system sensor histidine kinase YesM